MTYQIRNWSDHFENYKSKERDKCRFVCMPNKQDGAGLSRILSMPNGAALFGIWCLVIQRASKQPRPRNGWLTDDGEEDGKAWDMVEMAYLWRQDISLIHDALALFCSERIGWMSGGHTYHKQQSTQQVPRSTAEVPRSTAEVPRSTAEVPPGVLYTPKVSGEGMKEENQGRSQAFGFDWKKHRPPNLPRALHATWEQIASAHGGPVANAALDAARRIYGATYNHGQLSAAYQAAHRDGSLDLPSALWPDPNAKPEKPVKTTGDGFPTITDDEQTRIINEMIANGSLTGEPDWTA